MSETDAAVHVENPVKLKDGEPRSYDEKNGGAIWQHALVFVFCVICGALFLFVFSGLPYCRGDEIYVTLSGYYDVSFKVLAGSAFLALGLIALDVPHWVDTRYAFLAYALGSVAYVGFGVGALLAVKEYAYAPMAIFFLSAPFTLMIMKRVLFPRMDILAFSVSLRAALLVIASASLAVWCLWMFKEQNYWNAETKFDLYNRIKCNTSAMDFSNFTDVDGTLLEDLTGEERKALDDLLVGCLPAFLLWASPMILSLWCFVFLVVLFFLARTIRQSRNAADPQSAMDPLAQTFVYVVAAGIFGMWAAAGIQGTSMNLTSAVLALSFLGMVVLAAVTVAFLGSEVVQSGLAETPIGDRALSYVKTDLAKAFMLMGLAPFFLFYLCIAFFQQCSRKVLTCAKPLTEEQRRYWVSARAHHYLQSIYRWPWTAVLVYVLYIGLFVFLLFIGVVRMTTVFLAWLNAWLSTQPLAVTVGIFWAVGTFMFLNPFIPGVPVYITGGIVVVERAQESMGFELACLFVIGLCWALKMFAIVLQQKAIGEAYGSKKVWIRELVGVNSTEIKAIRSILLVPGMNFRKVTILCGGPDWPTSVLTGILKLNVFSMLWGSVPIVFLIAPTVMSGALFLKSNEGAVWASLSTMSLALTSAVQFGAMFAAVHFIAKEAVEKKEELDKLPLDQEVLAREQEKEAIRKLRAETSKWSKLDPFNKFLLVTCAILMTGSCYVFQFLGDSCFKSFAVSDSIEEDLDGDALSIVKPFGWMTLAVFCFPCVYLYLFNTYIGLVVKSKIKKNPELLTMEMSVAVSRDDSNSEQRISEKRKSFAASAALASVTGGFHS